MPYITDKKKIGNPALDRRVKLLPHQKEEIKRLHKKGMAIRAITRKYNVNRRLIQFILFPERHKKNLKDRKKRGGWKQYYKKEYHTEKIREHRRYKYATLTGRKDNADFLKAKAKRFDKHEQNSIKENVKAEIHRELSRKELKDWYVISNMKYSNGVHLGLSSEDIKKYPALVEATRQLIKFKRAVREKLKNKSTNKNQ